jgi:hypothetical protein
MLCCRSMLVCCSFGISLLMCFPAAAQRAGENCQNFGHTVIAQDKTTMLACLYSTPFPENSVERAAPPLIWKSTGGVSSAGITGGCSVQTGPTQFLNGTEGRGLRVVTRWGRGCKDEPNAGINSVSDNCSYAQDEGYTCGTISVSPSPTDAKHTPYICACVQQ